MIDVVGRRDDGGWMELAFALAERGRFGVSPNPMVGALLVQGDEIVGRGWHHGAGEPHAEILALEEAGERANGAVLYVTLEPCSHEGRTGPCADRLVEAGIERAVVAARDANPEVGGAGLERLEKADIEVVAELMPEREHELNARFRLFLERRRPEVVVKMASSLDGKIATASGESRWISGESSRARVQLLREEFDALAIGSGSILADNPRLNRRLGWNRRRPLVRIVFDRRLRTPCDARLFESGDPVLIVSGSSPDEERAAPLRDAGAELLPLGEAEALSELLEELGRRELTGLLVEGGGTLVAGLLAAGVVDRWIGFVAPILIGGAAAPSVLGGEGIGSLAEAPRLLDPTIEALGSDWMIQGSLSG